MQRCGHCSHCAHCSHCSACTVRVEAGPAHRIAQPMLRASGQASALLDTGLRPGVAVLPTGAWYRPQDPSPQALAPAGNPNVLS